VVSAASIDRLQASAALSEAIRRRRASGGPAEQTFATLVGLELRPRRLREAATLWAEMTSQHGVSARDGIWNHPDLLPRADDLDDPTGSAARFGAASGLDESAMAELTRLVNESSAQADDAAGSGAQGSTDERATERPARSSDPLESSESPPPAEGSSPTDGSDPEGGSQDDHPGT
jgi:Zincin-like metallopeptidase